MIDLKLADMFFRKSLSGIVIFLLSFAVWSAECGQQQCAAVVDVGSTGSRIYVYSYDLDERQNPSAITLVWSKKIRPGFSTLTVDESQINQYLNQLFDGLEYSHLPVYFYATAGMRLLPNPRQQQLYALVNKWFQKHPEYNLISARTITGTDEGVYGWLSVNYQLGALQENAPATGVMDMGGASVQVVFPVDSQTPAGNNVYKLELYGRQFTLFVHSFLGLGQMETSHQFMNSSACFIQDYELPTGQFATGDAFTCENEVSSFLNTVHKVNTLVQPVLNQNPAQRWYVLGGLVDLVKSPLFDFRRHEFTDYDLLQKANTKVCRQSWSFLHSEYPDDDYLYGSCLFPAYYYALIVNGYGLNPSQKIHYLDDSQNSSWTLGVILYSWKG